MSRNLAGADEAWTAERIAALGPTTDVPTTASILGVSGWTVYEEIKKSRWKTTRVLRLGRIIKIPTYDLLNFLYPGHVQAAPAAGPAAHAPLAAVGSSLAPA
ncbi:hypothetical protein [Frankia sp. AgB32]|uniref:hypothetical protein n=1 Tax=Frankia sp. AgB32 TaxID=631119 RepID=UPI00200BD662|nr:hypothetical protein [Frankia sp. AgB32]MCK9894734.1 hypothetical protein [Frankia sp. AgB32]